MIRLEKANVDGIAKSVYEDLRRRWISNPNILEMYGIIDMMTSLMYALYYREDETAVVSGPDIVTSSVYPEYRAISRKLCYLKEYMALEYGSDTFKVMCLEISVRWQEVSDLRDYLLAYTDAIYAMKEHCRKHKLKDVNKEIEHLQELIHCEDVIQLVAMLRAEGVITSKAPAIV